MTPFVNLHQTADWMAHLTISFNYLFFSFEALLQLSDMQLKPVISQMEEAGMHNFVAFFILIQRKEQL